MAMAMTNPSVLLCIVALWCAGFARSASTDCSTVVLSMADCLSFVTNGSKVSKPEGGCCAGLKTVLKTNPDCLCETFKNSGSLGIALNITKATTLPSACGLKSPPLTCATSAAPGTSPTPAASPAASPKSAKSQAPSSSPIPRVPSPTEAPSSVSSSSNIAPGPAKKSGASAISVSFIFLVTMVLICCSHFMA